MLNFLIVYKKANNVAPINNHDELHQFIPNGDKLSYDNWVSPNNQIEVHFWLPENTYFDRDYFIDISNSGIRLFNGWINDGNPLNTPLRKRGLEGLDSQSGEFVYINLESNGNGFFKRNLTSSVQTYYADNDDMTIVSNRACLINHLLRPNVDIQHCLDSNFLLWSISTSWAQDDCSLFRDVIILKQGVVINFELGAIRFIKPSNNMWFDSTMKELYAQDSNRYWDECYERLISNLNLFFDYFNEPFSFPLSGGKDSRLLLGLILNSNGRDLIENTITNGPPYSGEVIVGRLLSNHLKLKHTTNEGGYMGFDMTGNFGKHIFFTEGEVSPMDLTPNFTRVTKKMVLRGQEVGLRNISNVVENDGIKIEKWFDQHFNQFNHLGLIKEQFLIQRRHQFKEYWINNNEVVPSDLPTKNRIETRFLRWGGRIWTAHNTNEFTPFIFLDDYIVKSTFNAGAEARINEEFHFEMMKRCGYDLISIPFCNQNWPDKYGIESKIINHYQVDDKPMRGSHAVLFKNIEGIKKFILESNIRDILNDEIDWNKLSEFNTETLKSGHYQPFWQLVQMAAISNLTSFSQNEVSNIHLEIQGFPSLKDVVDNANPLSFEKSKTDKYKEVIINLLTEKETINDIPKEKPERQFKLFGYRITKSAD